MFKNKNIKTKEILSNEQPIDTFNIFYNKLTEIVIKIISDNSPIINNEHLLNTNKPNPNKKSDGRTQLFMTETYTDKNNN